MSAKEIPVDELRVLLNQMTEPARRHRCDACQQIFECHLCAIGEDHTLHQAGRPSRVWTFVCEDCIHKHELFVVVARFCDIEGRVPESTRRTGPYLHLGNHYYFYDHITGEFLGRGAIRYRGYSWGSGKTMSRAAIRKLLTKEPA